MKKFLVLYLISFASLNVYSNYTLDQETTIAEINGISLAYKSIGMKKNVHYIPFNGTYEDAEENIIEFLDNPSKIDRMPRSVVIFEVVIE